MNYDKLDVFNPYIIVFAILMFVLISMPIHLSYMLHYPTYLLYCYILLGILFFIFGILFSNFLLKKINIKNRLNYSILSSDFNLKKLSVFDKYSNFEILLIGIVLFSLLLLLINFFILGGIPLFSGYLKKKAATKLWFFSFIVFLPSINILLAKFNRKTHYLLLFLGIILFSLTGYRTTPIAILLSSFITLYYTRKIPVKYQILFILLISILLVSVGFVAVKSIEWQKWKLNALELVSYRAGFTLNILDKAIYLQGITHGKLFYYTLTGFFSSVDPRVIAGNFLIGKNQSITSTIFGPALLDFGVIGMSIQMFIIGFILKMIHTIQNYKHGIITAFYGILLAQSLIWIETGPTDLVVWLFYLVGIIILIYNFYKLYHIEIIN